MAETDGELAGLKACLERLERSNRRWRYGAMAGLAVAGLIGLVAAQRATPPVPGVIRAHKFELVDGAGAVQGSLETVKGDSELTLTGLDGPESLVLTAQSLTMGKVRADSIAPIVELNRWTGMDIMSDRGYVSISSGANYSISVRDASGYETDIGATSLVTPSTGETHQTSAASIVMFGNDKDRKVIWQVP